MNYFGIYCRQLLKEANIDIGEIVVSSIPDDPIWHSETMKVDITLLEFDMSSTSVVFKSRFNSLKQIYCDIRHMYTGRSEVETKVDYVYTFVIMEHRVID